MPGSKAANLALLRLEVAARDEVNDLAFGQANSDRQPREARRITLFTRCCYAQE